MFRSRWFGWAALCLACGSSPAVKPAAQATVDVASPARAEEVRIELVQRSASDLLKRHWVAGSSAEFALYADLEGLARTQSFATFVSAILKQLALSLTAEEGECAAAMLTSPRELAMSLGRNLNIVLLRFEPNALKVPPASCLSQLLRLEPASMEGVKEAYSADGAPLVILPGLIVLGDKDAIGPALAGDSPSKWPTALDLAPDQYVAFNFRPGSEVQGHGKLTANPERLRFDCQANLESDEEAASLERRLRSMLREPPDEELPGIGHLMKAFQVERSGQRLATALELTSSATAQTAELDAAAKFAAYVIAEAVRDAKRSEARRAVRLIAGAYVKFWNDEAKPTRGKQKLFSLPPVPGKIPSGTRFQSTLADWKPWEKIGFSRTGWQVYQYEVIAAKDGKSAEIVARGDLDGDGKASAFVTTIKIESDGLYTDYNLQETDPEE